MNCRSFGRPLGFLSILLGMWMASCGGTEVIVPGDDGTCTPLQRKCSGSDVVVCAPSGEEWNYLRSCPSGCSQGECLDRSDDDLTEPEGDATQPEDSESPSFGCLTCPCGPEEYCNAGLTCFAGICIAPGCQTNEDCPEGKRCYLSGCIPEACGNGTVESGEECDDGNNKNGDGCNVNCDNEPKGAIAGGEPLGFIADPSAMPVAFSECDDSNERMQYSPGDTIEARLCVLSYLDQNGLGLSAAQVEADVAKAQAYYTAAGTNIVLKLVHTETLQGTPDQTDADSSAEIDKLLADVRSYADANWPGQCQLVLGYVLSLKGDSGVYGGMGTWPSEGLHSAVVTKYNVETVPGQTAAHELGHVMGLFHTHETYNNDNDGCSDTAPDSACYNNVPPTCSIQCPDGTWPPAQNVMSYYFCKDARSDSFSPCQTRRARCFLSKMFPASACPVPVLTAPADSTLVSLGETIKFKWNNTTAQQANYLVIRRDPPSGPVVFNQSVGTASSKTVSASELGVGNYAWTISYNNTCCPEGLCQAVERRFSIQTVGCSGVASQSCGYCGTQTRTCNGDGTWSNWSACSNPGECSPGSTKNCTYGGSVSCTDQCTWPTCATCTPNCDGKCLGESDGCGGTCSYNGCSGCCQDGVCMAGDTAEACGSYGSACISCVASAYCNSGACSGCSKDDWEYMSCYDNDTPECAQAYLYTFSSESDQWLEGIKATAYPEGDIDYYLVQLTDTAFFATLDPTIEVANPTADSLEACVWWRNADGSPSSLLSSCSGGTATTGPNGEAGCCTTVLSGATGKKLSISVTDAPGEALFRITGSWSYATCAQYTFRLHL